MMTFTNLEKYVYSKNDVNLPHPSLQQSRRYFHAEKSPKPSRSNHQRKVSNRFSFLLLGGECQNYFISY